MLFDKRFHWVYHTTIYRLPMAGYCGKGERQLGLDKTTMKKILAIAAFTVILYWGLNNLSLLLSWARALLALLSPFILGSCIAFILSVPMKGVERLLFGWADGRGKHGWAQKIKRPVSIVLTICLFIAVIWFVVFLVVPELLRTLGIISDAIPPFIRRMQTWSTGFMAGLPDLSKEIAALQIDWMGIWKNVAGFLSSSATNVLNSTFTVASSVFNGVFNFILGLIFAIYILMQKEKLAQQGKRVLYAVFPERAAAYMLNVSSLTHRTFSSFLTGQCLEAVILGAIFFVSMTLFRFPYALMISVLIAFTALIPIFGAFIGCFVGAFLILVTDPLKALWFLILFLVLQQIEGNLIYPRVVGSSVGLPSLWVLVAVTLGGSTMGVLGMLIFVPLFSVLYAIARESVAGRLSRKGIAQEKFEPRESPPARKPAPVQKPKGTPKN